MKDPSSSSSPCTIALPLSEFYQDSINPLSMASTPPDPPSTIIRLQSTPSKTKNSTSLKVDMDDSLIITREKIKDSEENTSKDQLNNNPTKSFPSRPLRLPPPPPPSGSSTTTKPTVQTEDDYQIQEIPFPDKKSLANSYSNLPNQQPPTLSRNQSEGSKIRRQLKDSTARRKAGTLRDLAKADPDSAQKLLPYLSLDSNESEGSENSASQSETSPQISPTSDPEKSPTTSNLPKRHSGGSSYSSPTLAPNATVASKKKRNPGSTITSNNSNNNNINSNGKKNSPNSRFQSLPSRSMRPSGVDRDRIQNASPDPSRHSQQYPPHPNPYSIPSLSSVNSSTSAPSPHSPHPGNNISSELQVLAKCVRHAIMNAVTTPHTKKVSTSKYSQEDVEDTDPDYNGFRRMDVCFSVETSSVDSRSRSSSSATSQPNSLNTTPVMDRNSPVLSNQEETIPPSPRSARSTSSPPSSENTTPRVPHPRLASLSLLSGSSTSLPSNPLTSSGSFIATGASASGISTVPPTTLPSSSSTSSNNISNTNSPSLSSSRTTSFGNLFNFFEEKKTIEFSLKEYCPAVFRSLRNSFGYSVDVFIESLEHYSCRIFRSQGKSKSFFMLPANDKFIVKTLTQKEAIFLVRILQKYVTHLNRFPHSLVPLFLGLYKITLKRSGELYYFCMMENIFQSHLPIHHRFDVKGSTVGRETTEEDKRNGVTMKDNDLKNINLYLNLSSQHAKLLKDQLSIDLEFLQSINIMDYSLLIGVHTSTDPLSPLLNTPPSSPAPGSANSSNRSSTSMTPPNRSPRSPILGGSVVGPEIPKMDSKNQNQNQSQSQDQENISTTVDRSSVYSNGGNENENEHTYGLDQNENEEDGVENYEENENEYENEYEEESENEYNQEKEVEPNKQQQQQQQRSYSDLGNKNQKSNETNNETENLRFLRPLSSHDGNQLYFIGIIDVLTEWNLSKIAESTFKSMLYQRENISAVPPSDYAKRFQTFVSSLIKADE